MPLREWKIIITIISFIASCANIVAQNPDTIQIKQNIDSSRAYRYDDDVKAIHFAHIALIESGDDFYYGRLNALQLIADIYYQRGQMDSAILNYHEALRASQTKRDLIENGNNYCGLGTVYMESGDPDSALVNFRKATQAFEAVSDSSSLCDIYLRTGNVFNNMGNHDQAIRKYMQSIRICEAIDNDQFVAYNYGAIGIINDKQGNYPVSEEYFLKARDEFTRIGDVYGQMNIANNLGILYKNMKAFDKSLLAYERCLMLADSLDFDRGFLSANTNLGILNIELGRFESALQHAATGLKYAELFQDREAYADNLNSMARGQLGLKNYSDALVHAQAALQIGKEVRSLEKQRDANLTLSDIYGAQHRFEQSLHFYKQYTLVKDSLYDIERAHKIAELTTVYETEKKDQEILLLAKNVELDRTRKKLLAVGLALSILAGALLFYSQWIRRVRDRKLRLQEKALEEQQRKTLELENEKISRELEFKKQELVAKALQLARKNEFLQSLNLQVEHLKDDAEGEIADTARKISRQIRVDINSEEDWEQFLSSFREVHRDFIDQLLSQYPDVTPSEMRLACLMKMNLSGKEIASMLNITQDGVKKSRYRLRKKLNIDSDTDIQHFLLGFPSGI